MFRILFPVRYTILSPLHIYSYPPTHPVMRPTTSRLSGHACWSRSTTLTTSCTEVTPASRPRARTRTPRPRSWVSFAPFREQKASAPLILLDVRVCAHRRRGVCCGCGVCHTTHLHAGMLLMSRSHHTSYSGDGSGSRSRAGSAAGPTETADFAQGVGVRTFLPTVRRLVQFHGGSAPKVRCVRGCGREAIN
jgi:hypothetical protein